MIYSFKTDTVIPMMAFTSFGVNAKPNSDNPLGYFGTGLKYAVSIILRSGGTIRLLVDGVEYEFYTNKQQFRGKDFNVVRMKKRTGLLSSWRYEALPFTTELGKNWGLWQAFRELESNTRDENGWSGATEHRSTLADSKGKTIIEVDCNNFVDVAGQLNEVFLDEKGPLIFENDKFAMYDSPSKYLYYRGVRVHSMRYPARFTYDFKKGIVVLSEDRSAVNDYMLFHYVSSALMREIQDKAALNKALNSTEGQTHFEGHDISFSSAEYGISDAFRTVATRLGKKGFSPAAVSGALYTSSRPVYTEPRTEVTLLDAQWELILCTLRNYVKDVTVVTSEEEQAIKALFDKFDVDVPF